MYPRRDATHEAHLTVRLLGPHEVTGHMVSDHLQVMMPGATVAIADKQALTDVYRTIIEAGLLARGVFTGDRRSFRLFRRTSQRIVGAVLISGRQPGPTVFGKTPQISPSGCGQLVIRLGRLTIVCDDRAAWQSQELGWRAAAATAAAHWGGPALRQIETKAEQRAADRFRERHEE